MSIFDKPSLSTSFYDPEAEPVPEPEPTPDPPKRRGRPPGSKSQPKKKPLPWFSIFRAVFWAAVSLFSITALYFGVQSWLGQSAAYLSVAVVAPIMAFLLDRDWKKMRTPQ